MSLIDEVDAQRGQKKGVLSLEMFRVKKEYTEALGQEVWLYPNLLIKNHTLTIIGKTGSAKSAFFLREVIPKLCREGLTVWYFDADSPTNDHPWIRQHAEQYGFEFLNPHANKGTSIEQMLELLVQLIESDHIFVDHVLLFDTLKKFASMLDKNSLKGFYNLQRRLTARGATTVALGHCNKTNRDNGDLIFEGTNEVITDTDELIYFYKTPSYDGVDVTTVVDIEKDAKTRGVFEPFSFNIDSQRNITLYKQPIDLNATTTNKVPDGVITDSVTKCIREHGQPVSKKELVGYAWQATKAGRDRIDALIDLNSVPKGARSSGWKMFTWSKGDKSAKYYELTSKQ